MKLRNKKIFVDTSAFIKFLHGDISKEGENIFKAALEKNLKLFTSSRCLDELIFKEMRIIAQRDYNIGAKVIEKLKRDPEMVKEIGRKLSKIIKPFLNKYGVFVMEIKNEWVLQLPELMQQTGLFGNDALIIRAMQSRNLRYLLTADKDFRNIADKRRMKIIFV